MGDYHHKSQGLTFEHAIIDASRSFSYGQTYVALSRCKSLEGMVLSAPLSPSAIIGCGTIEQFNSHLASPTPEVVSALEQQYILRCIGELFDFCGIYAAYELLMRCLVEFYNVKYPRLVGEYQQMNVVLKSLEGVSEKFQLQYTNMLAVNPDLRSADLQDRIHKGAKYFGQKMGVLVDLVKKTNVATDNKVAKKQFQERFSSFELEVNLKHRLLKYSSDAEFLISDYLRKKAQFLLMEEDEAAGSSGRGRSRQRVSRSAGGDADGEPRKPKVPTREISYGLFCRGMNLDQIAAERNLTKGTIIGHLTPYVMEGKIGLRTFISSAHEKNCVNSCRLIRK